jgi:hypothetical protein
LTGSDFRVPDFNIRNPELLDPKKSFGKAGKQ